MRDMAASFSMGGRASLARIPREGSRNAARGRSGRASAEGMGSNGAVEFRRLRSYRIRAACPVGSGMEDPT